LDHAALQALQLKLIEQGMGMLAEGGRLVYSTCSIDPMENGKLVAKFVEGKGVRVSHEEATLPSLSNAAESTRDGGYFAVLAR